MAADLRAEVKTLHGSPTLLVNGEPRVPLVFFGLGSRPGSKVVTVGPQWREYHLTFVAPEDNAGQAGVQFRVGGGPPGTVWVDNARLYPGEKRDEPAENMLRFGDWEGTKEQMKGTWVLFQRPDQGADVGWDVDPQTKVSGRQSCRITIRGTGKSFMHAHFFQTGMTVKQGQRYTYSLWMKSDEERKVDFMALHQGPPWTIYSPEGDSVYESQVRLAAGAGVHLHSFPIGMPWPRPGEQPNWQSVDGPTELTLHSDPDGLLLPRFGCGPPQWWLEQHPDEVMRFSDGKTDGMSMASELWRQECLKNVRALVRHCEEKYGDHMLGYHPCGQHTGEWFYQRSWEPVLSDFSPAMDAGFRKWVEQRYGTEAMLRQAWRDGEAAFASVTVPTAEEQSTTSLGFFRDPQTERKVIDYFEYKQLAMEQPLEAIARAIKQETQGSKIVTFFYGYTFDMHGIPMGPQTSGHLAMARMLRCPDVDILTSPISYSDRQLGGAGMFMCAVDSVRGAGKLWLNEDDTRTYLTPEEAGFGRVPTPQGTFWVHRRNFAQLLPRRLACWYMDLGGTGWLNGADIWQNVARLRALYQRTLPRPASWSPEIAVIMDEVSPYYSKCTRNLHSPLVYQMRSQCFRLGAPVRIHLLSDLTAGRVPSAKAHILLNCFHLTREDRRAIAAVSRGKTTIWFYGAGYLGEKADDANLATTVGLDLRRGQPQPGRVTPDPNGGELVAGLDGKAFGTDTVLDPIWSVEAGENVRVIGRYTDGSVAAALKADDTGTTAYIGALHAPARLLRNILRHAGVHLYADSDDVVLADRDFLGIAATGAGPKHLRLPERRTVVDALTGETVATDATAFTVDMQLGETRLLWLRPPWPGVDADSKRS